MRHLLLATLFIGALTPASAALPPLSPEERTEYAEVILTGEVLVSRAIVHRKPGASIYLVRLGAQVNSVEKGQELLGDSKTVEIRCWALRKTKMAGPAGHSDIPADGSEFKVWLHKNLDGQWEPLEPNGFELLSDSPAMTFATAERRELGKSVLIGGVTGLLVLGVLIWFRVAK